MEPSTILFFDLDGTIMINPFWRVVFPAVSELLAQHSGATPNAMLNAIIAENQRRLEAPSGNSVLTWDWDDIVQAVARAHNIPKGCVPADFCEALATEHAAPPYTAHIDNSREVLLSLRSPRRRLVVATMGLSKYQIPVLRGLGLYACFDDFLMPDLAGHPKTDRGYYERYLGSTAKKISIGDNYSHDVQIPKSLGFQAVLRAPIPDLNAFGPFERVDRLDPYGAQIQHYPIYVECLPDAVVTHLRELPAVVARLEGDG